jgi:hypothetical protein
LRPIRLLIFLAELNDLQTWATDIGNAYLEALTLEKVCIIASPEFGNLQGHVMIIYKTLYGLCSSGACWHDRFSDCLHAEDFFSCKAEPDIWLRPKSGVYEYIAVLWMIWQLLWLICRNLWMYWKRSTSLSSREPEQLLFTLAATSFVMMKAFCAWLQRNTLRR